MTQRIIIDACGWVAIIDAGINFEIELEHLFGKFELITLPEITNELEKLNLKRARKNSLLLELLTNKSTEIDHLSNDLRHTDDIIYDLAVNQNLAVLTVDKNLKRRLFKSGIDVIEVVKNNHLNLIEGL
jgi:rRNA-processing protein FCF1|tara:strand:+ start:1175 stop:1561 length:387 start_codon:yes stop_codon:yes gene_type:complete